MRGLVASLPVTAGFTPFARVLGAQAAQKGLTAVETPLMTVLNFAGGSEFAAIGLWTVGEILCASANPVLVTRLAPPDQRATYQGLFHASWSAAALSPALGAWAMDHLGANADELWKKYFERLQAAGVERDAAMPVSAGGACGHH